MKLLKESNDRLLQIEVCDTGIGIPEDKLDKIFEPFFQTDLPKSIVNMGSCIGLSIPINDTATQPDVAQPDVVPSLTVDEKVSEPAIMPGGTLELQSGKQRKKTLLLVEDNDDFRFYRFGMV